MDPQEEFKGSTGADQAALPGPLPAAHSPRRYFPAEGVLDNYGIEVFSLQSCQDYRVKPRSDHKITPHSDKQWSLLPTLSFPGYSPPFHNSHSFPAPE